MLGSRVDAALSNFFPIRMHRAKLGLAGNGGEAPAWHELFLGKAKLIGETATHVHTSFNKATRKLNSKLIPNITNAVKPNGDKYRQITLDVSDADKLPRIIQRERKLHNLPPLSKEELASEIKKCISTPIENPLIQIDIDIGFQYLRHAMMKIAYELAFLWLGESYLDDPVASELRSAICNVDISSTDNISGYVGFTNEDGFNVFHSWIPHEEHHLAYASVVGNTIVISLRVFHLYAAVIIVSREPSKYLQSAADLTKLRFLAIDAVGRKTINTSFDAELKRIAEAMTQHQRLPPFQDPL